MSPTHEPVFYLAVGLILYQIFGQKQPIDDYWLQYLIELVAGGSARQIVKPLAKLKGEDNVNNGPAVSDR